LPKSNRDYWKPKLERNVWRDRKAKETLENMGWKILVIWECETMDRDLLEKRVSSFLGRDRGGQQ
jgi:DNA mismatch endonuclease (patch repair protein)